MALSAGAKRRFGSCDSDYPSTMGEYYSKCSRGKEIIFDNYSKKIFLKILGVKGGNIKKEDFIQYTCTHAGNQPFFPYLSPPVPNIWWRVRTTLMGLMAPVPSASFFFVEL